MHATHRRRTIRLVMRTRAPAFRAVVEPAPRRPPARPASRLVRQVTGGVMPITFTFQPTTMQGVRIDMQASELGGEALQRQNRREWPHPPVGTSKPKMLIGFAAGPQRRPELAQQCSQFRGPP